MGRGQKRSGRSVGEEEEERSEVGGRGERGIV